MPEMARSLTREMVLALPDDGNRYELLGGELLVSPAPKPRHQLVVGALLVRLDAFLRVNGMGHVFTSPSDVSLDGEQLVQPDVFVVQWGGAGVPDDWSALSLPLLVIEVLSPSTARYDRQVKRRWFQQAGIQEYWIVDPFARQVERWRPADDRPEVLDDSIAWMPTGAGQPLIIDLVAFFRETLGPSD